MEKFYEVLRCQGIFLAIYFQSMQRLKILMYGGVNLKCLKSNWLLHSTPQHKENEVDQCLTRQIGHNYRSLLCLMKSIPRDCHL